MKLKDVLAHAHANIWHNPVRAGLTVAAIFVGACTLSLALGLREGVTRFLDVQVGTLGGHNSLIIFTRDNDAGRFNKDEPHPYKPRKHDTSGILAGFGRNSMDAADLDKIREVQGIVDARARQSVSITYIAQGENKYELNCLLYDEDQLPNEAVGVPPDNKTFQHQMEIPPKFAQALGFGSDLDVVNKEVRLGVMDVTGKLTEISAKVVAVQRRNLVGVPYARLNKPLFEDVFLIQHNGVPDIVRNRFYSAKAHFDPAMTLVDLEALKSRLNAKGYHGVTIRDQLGSTKDFIELITNVLGATSAISLVAATFGVGLTQLMAVKDRTKEIGLMKAMGMGWWGMFGLVSAEAGLLGIWGGCLGAAFGSALGVFGNAYAHNGSLKELDGLNPFTFSLPNTLVVLATIFVVTCIAGALPSFRAARLDPITALRYE